MKYDPEIHHRRSIRLQGYDYSQDGTYFVTLCTHNRENLLGEIKNGEMILNEYGKIIAESWEWLGVQYDYVELDAWVIMPNHMHGIIVINQNGGGSGRGGSRTAPTRTAPPVKTKSLGRLIGAFKTVSTKRINQIRKTPGAIVWQRNYWDHIIRDEKSLRNIRNYIINNPLQWEEDENNIRGKMEYGRQ
jgi:REP element-mobilizing transposase RayT